MCGQKMVKDVDEVFGMFERVRDEIGFGRAKAKQTWMERTEVRLILV